VIAALRNYVIVHTATAGARTAKTPLSLQGLLEPVARKRARPVLRGPRRSNAPGLPHEVWFSIIERQAIRRGAFRSVKDLNAKIRAFIDNWNDDRAHPFIWTKTADEILAKANGQTTSNSGH
jgi:hypothetical protein